MQIKKPFLAFALSTMRCAPCVLSVVLFALCFPVQAQHPAKKLIRIGYLGNASPPAEATREEAFLQALREHGWIESQNIVIERRYWENHAERLPALAVEFVRLKVDVIVTGRGGRPVALAVKNATTTIPIVAASLGDPVADGLVASFAQPGGNLTGFSNVAPDLARRRLEIVKETIPSLTRLAFLWSSLVTDPSNPGVSRVKETQAAAEALGLRLLSLDVRNADELASAFESAMRERAGALMVPGYIERPYEKQITDFWLKKRLPVSCDTRESVEQGVCLIAYGPSLPQFFRRAAIYVDKILKGTKPGDLPIERPMKFEFVISLKIAKQIGLPIPPNVLARADKVIR
jgi:putative tryptophan/tyrosine transport system substrate-binding protein